MGMAAKSERGAPNINITPLIDVLLVLLIIFMVITPMKPHRFETKIPEKPLEQDIGKQTPSELLVLTIDKDRRLSLNQQAIEPAELARQLSEIIARRPSDQRTLFIKAPKALSYSYVVGVLDTVKGAGAAPIGLQVDYLDEI